MCASLVSCELYVKCYLTQNIIFPAQYVKHYLWMWWAGVFFSYVHAIILYWTQDNTRHYILENKLPLWGTTQLYIFSLFHFPIQSNLMLQKLDIEYIYITICWHHLSLSLLSCGEALQTSIQLGKKTELS